jgi:hypothetical protein
VLGATSYLRAACLSWQSSGPVTSSAISALLMAREIPEALISSLS